MTLFVNKLLSVQPLQGPTGQIFYHSFRYGQKNQAEPVYKKPRLTYRDLDAAWWEDSMNNSGYFMQTHGFDMELFMAGSCQAQDLYVMRGIPGCGKSFRAKKLSERLSDAPILSADNFFGEGEEYKKNWSISKAHLGHRDCEAKALAAMKAKTPSVIIDNTNLVLSMFRTYLDYAVDLGYAVHFVYPDSPWWVETVEPFLRSKKADDESKARAVVIAQLLFEKNVHGVPAQTLTDMLMKFQWVVYDEYVDATHQRVLALEKDLEDMKGRARKLDSTYL